MAEKLDGVMLVVLTYLDQRLTANASLPPETILQTPSGCADDADSDGGSCGQSVAPRDSSAATRKRRTSEGGDGVESVARLLKVCEVVVVGIQVQRSVAAPRMQALLQVFFVKMVVPYITKGLVHVLGAVLRFGQHL